MKIVFAKHFNSEKEYLFETTIPILRGDLLEVETVIGNSIARATTGSISIAGDGVYDICERLGVTKFPLKQVVGRISPKLFYHISDKVEDILNKSDNKDSELREYFNLLPF